MSKAAIHGRGHILRTFPDAAMGRWNCRKISGSSRWSEHAWGNGLDITRAGFGYSEDEEHQALLDETYAWLDGNRRNLSIRQILWRVRDHYNHIHVDFWPKGYGTPPCAGGELKMQYPTWYNGGQVVKGDPGPMYGAWEGEQENDVITRGDRNADVAKLQDYLNRWVEDWVPGGTDQWYPLTLDGDYGSRTALAVSDFQEWANLEVRPDQANAITVSSLTLVLRPDTAE